MGGERSFAEIAPSGEVTPIPDLRLLIVDVQRAIDDPSWAADGPRNNPGAEANIAALLANWRQLGYPIFHVKHALASNAAQIERVG